MILQLFMLNYRAWLNLFVKAGTHIALNNRPKQRKLNLIKTIGIKMHKLDLRNSLAPFSLLEISNVMKRMKTGEILEVLGDEPSIRTDLKKIIPDASYEMLGIETHSEGDDQYRMLLKKKNPIKKGETTYPQKTLTVRSQTQVNPPCK